MRLLTYSTPNHNVHMMCACHSLFLATNRRGGPIFIGGTASPMELLPYNPNPLAPLLTTLSNNNNNNNNDANASDIISCCPAAPIACYHHGRSYTPYEKLVGRRRAVRVMIAKKGGGELNSIVAVLIPTSHLTI